MEQLSLTLADVIVLALVALSALIALLRGFVREVLSIAAWGGAALLAAYGFDYARPYIASYIENRLAADMATLAGIFIVSLMVLTLISRAIARQVQDSPFNFLDRVLGILFGVARAMAVIAIAYLILLWIWGPDGEPKWVRDAKSRDAVVWSAKVIESVIPERMRQGVLDKAQPAINDQLGVIKKPDIGYSERHRSDLNRLLDTVQGPDNRSE